MKELDLNNIKIPKKSGFIQKKIKHHQLKKTGIIREVEACKICDGRCNYCEFDCNCSTLVDPTERRPSRVERGLKNGMLKKVPVLEDEAKQSFKKALSDLYTVDWTETDGSDVEKILKDNLLGGISVHKGYWLDLVEKETSLNKFQKEMLKSIINRN